MPPARKTALVAGHLTLDLVPDLTAFTADQIGGPSTARVGAMHIGLGGAVGNTGAALARLGVRTRIGACVADDHLGDMTRERLERVEPGLARGLHTRHGAASSYSIVIAPSDIDRVFWHHAGPNTDFGPEHVSDAALAEADLLHFAYPTELPRFAGADGAEVGRLLRRAKAAGTTTSIDVTPRGRLVAYFDAVFPHLDIFQPDLEEATQLFFPDLDDPPRFTLDVLRHVSGGLHEAGVAIVGLTLGSKGLYLRTSDDPARIESLGRGGPGDAAGWVGRELFAAPRRVELRSASAAGDIATAALMAALLDATPPEDAVTMSAAAGAWAVELFDTTGNLPGSEDLSTRIAAGWELLPPGVELPGWVETPTPGIWAPGSR